MTYLFSSSTKGFYITGVHSTIPSDAVQITDEEYKTVMAALSNGNVLTVVNNKPATQALTYVTTWDMIRTKRDNLLRDCDWTQMPDVNLTSEKKTAWLTYRQQLRDITTQTVEPKDVVWPTPPA